MVNCDVSTSTVFSPGKTHPRKYVTSVHLNILGFETDNVESDKAEGSLSDKHCYSFLWLWTTGLWDEVQLLTKNWLDTKTTIFKKLCVASPLRATRIMLSRILRIKLYSASVQWQFKPSHKLETNTLWSRGKTIYSGNQINKIIRKQCAASTDSSH